MVNVYLRETMYDALEDNSLLLLDKGVTCVNGSSLGPLKKARLPLEVPEEDLLAVRERFRQWVTAFNSPCVQTVHGVVDEVASEHKLLSYRSKELAQAVTDSFAQGELSLYQRRDHLTRLALLDEVREEFSFRPELTRQNRYVSRDYGSHERLFQRVLSISQECESKKSWFKEHDTDNQADEQLVAAALDHSRYYGSAGLITTDKDLDNILRDYQQEQEVLGSVSVYRFKPKVLVTSVYESSNREVSNQELVGTTGRIAS